MHRISLLARNGAVLADVHEQVERLANLMKPVTRCVVSCGGDDLLGLLGAMQSSVYTVIDAAELIAC